MFWWLWRDELWRCRLLEEEEATGSLTPCGEKAVPLEDGLDWEKTAEADADVEEDVVFPPQLPPNMGGDPSIIWDIWAISGCFMEGHWFRYDTPYWLSRR